MSGEQFDFLCGDFTQPELRDPTKERTRREVPKGYAGTPGQGPDGETCKTCAHYRRRGTGSGKTFRKCALVNWTRGAGTDIKAGSPACQFWEEQE